MPLFDLSCKTCPHTVVDVLCTNEESLKPKDCPECGGAKTLVRKDFYPTAFNFYGAGWSGSGHNCNNLGG